MKFQNIYHMRDSILSIYYYYSTLLKLIIIHCWNLIHWYRETYTLFCSSMMFISCYWCIDLGTTDLFFLLFFSWDYSDTIFLRLILNMQHIFFVSIALAIKASFFGWKFYLNCSKITHSVFLKCYHYVCVQTFFSGKVLKKEENKNQYCILGKSWTQFS